MVPSPDSDRGAILETIRDEIRRRRRFLVTSHAAPDGDSIGSQLAMAFALRALGRDVRIVNRDPAPPHYFAFPGVSSIEIADRVDGDYEALIVMECGDLGRPGVSGLEPYFTINLDHHVGNTMYGDVNWYDGTAAACGEMVHDVIGALGVPLSREIATHIYLAILTDTGSFHHSSITTRTFEICRRCVEAGVDAAAMARQVFDSNSFGKLKLIGALLASMELAAGGRLAVLHLTDGMLSDAGCTYNDLEGLINLPLTAREIRSVVFFKAVQGIVKVSLRSKEDIDVRAVALRYGGGGHRNASGFTAEGHPDDLRPAVIGAVEAAIEAGSA